MLLSRTDKLDQNRRETDAGCQERSTGSDYESVAKRSRSKQNRADGSSRHWWWWWKHGVSTFNTMGPGYDLKLPTPCDFVAASWC